MTLRGTQLNTLQAVAHIQILTSIDSVEDMQLAEALGLDINSVRSILNHLSAAGYIRLEKFETLAGMSYLASLTSLGQNTLM
jgi:DNA-binding MarR family transcriptional regulator